ncbi:ABC transporter substrate-binding protein [Polaromonas sp. UBA4122]|uniref:ABC transporter substrate-binding protein n=1 Tax=Polaromonas sp. UBA4122 TaxID=1947074 RepID=UPI0039C9E036
MLAFVAALSAGMSCAGVGAQTVTAVMQSGLRVLDPIITTAYMTRNHGYMIYDTLLATDADNKIRPQMAEKWDISSDKKTYTFTLRHGLKWHDGAPVKAEDCVASIKRWSEQDKMGQILMTMVVGMKTVNDKSFQITLKQPTDLVLQALAKPSGPPPFMMPKRIAETPSTQAIKEYIGSGPFKFVAADFKPGIKVVYEKNKDYVPRTEAPSGLAGGKVVHVDRVEWVTMPDSLTTLNALANGEIDYVEQVPYDLLPMVEGKAGIKVEVVDKLGYQTVYRFNHLHAPFNNKLLRQAAMYAVSQEDVMKAVVGNPKYYKTCPSVFGCGTEYSSTGGADMVVPSNIEKAKQLLKEAKYDGTPVVILQPTDINILAAQPVVIAQALRKAGFVVQLQAMDWQSVIVRRAIQKPPTEGGWSIFSTFNVIPDIVDPLRNFQIATNGKQAWFGWPDIPKIEQLRQQFAHTTDAAERKKLSEEIQKLVYEEGVIVPLGEFSIPSAYRTSLSGILEGSVPVFWNMKKTGK